MKVNIEIKTNSTKENSQKVLEDLMQSLNQIEKRLHLIDEVRIFLNAED